MWLLLLPSIFKPLEIKEWVADIYGTTICPYCGIDSVIGKSSSFPIAKEFLEKIKSYWF